MTKLCSIESCTSPILARGWCKRHYDRWRRHGDPSVCMKAVSERGKPTEWLLGHATHTSGECLIWPYARFPDGRAHMRGDKPARVMCRLAHGAPPSKHHQAAHSCGKAHNGCVNPQHLRWATPAENTEDKVKHGTLLRGSQLPQAKLTEADVRKIRELEGSLYQREIAVMFGVKTPCVNQILRRRSWRHVL